MVGTQTTDEVAAVVAGDIVVSMDTSFVSPPPPPPNLFTFISCYKCILGYEYFYVMFQALDMEEAGVEVAEVMVMDVDVDEWATVQGVAATTRHSL